ncbi:MAG: type IV secretory system conjugative DNA transfer family protein [bacterium]|nr:type IV secretory system conjugative DNA transfer family protein [bacterium]
MKLKITAEPKDFIIFGIFCLFLLYLCCIAVLNISYISTEGVFWGLSPFKAFTSKYIGATIVLFVAGLVGAFASVSSYFFDRESGFGFSTNKKDKGGYSRWAKKEEIKKQLVEIDPKAYKTNGAGIAVINDGKKLWVDNGEAHNIIVGATGSGKTQIVVFPLVQSLAKHDESMIITDPKGEIYETTGNMLRERGYNIVLLNFRNPQNGNAWNPMNLPYTLYKEGNTDKAIELLDDLALNILYEEKQGGSDPFWEKTAADYFTGLALGLFEDAKEEQINLNSINLMSSMGEERFGGPNNNYIKEYFNGKDPSKPAYINASGTVYAPEDTKGGVLSTFKQKIKLFSSRENLSEMLAYNNFDMKEIGRQKTAVFMIVQDEKKTLHPLATIFIKQCYETLIDVAQENGGKLPHRTNFILDEFANMPKLKDATTMVTAARSRLIRFNFIIQNYAQLTQVYGKEEAETIKGNCNIMYLISNELQALEEISKMCGEVKSKEKDKTASTPLVTVSDLQRLSQFEIIALRLRTMPFKTKLTPNYKMDWGKTYEKADYPTRQKKEVQLFDIKEYVKNKKKEKMDSMMSNNMNPFGGNDSPFNPFGGGRNELFGGNNPFMIPSNINNDMPSSDPGFNIDDLVKKIDAKIAELEEDEKKEKENNKIIDAQVKNNKEENKDDKMDISINDNKETSKEDILASIEREYSSAPINNDFVNNYTNNGAILDIPKPTFNSPLPSKTYDEVKESGIFDDLTTDDKTSLKELENNHQNNKDKLYENNTDDDAFFDDFFSDD